MSRINGMSRRNKVDRAIAVRAAGMGYALPKEEWGAWDAQEMLCQYRLVMRRLEQRRDEVASEARGFTKRLELLNQEIDEIAEVLRCLRQYTA